MDQHHMA